jgi:branched-chain amino acid transport system substrate-binding protein
MMRRSLGVLAATGLLATSLAAPAVAQDKVVNIPDGEPVTLGVFQVLSGPNAVLGQDMVYGIEIAVADRDGEILGHEINLLIQDELCTVEGGAQAALAIASDPTVVGLVGSSCSDATVGAMQTITEAGLSTVSGSATRPSLTEPDRGPEYAGFLRTAWSDAIQGKFVAEFVQSLGLTKAATIHDGSAYAEALVGVFEEEFEALGGEITIKEAVSAGQTDMNPVLTNVAQSEPEVIYFPIFTAEGGFIADQQEGVAGLEDVVLVGSDGLFSLDFVRAAGDGVEGMYLSSPNFDLFQESYADLVEKYLDISGLDSPLQAFHAHAYDAASIMLSAIEAVAVENEDGSMSVDLGALREALYATTDFPGVTGSLSCTPTGDCSAPLIAVYQVVADTIENEVWPPAVVWTPEG